MKFSRFKSSLKRTQQDMSANPTDNYFKTVRFREDNTSQQIENNQYTMDVLSTIKAQNKITSHQNYNTYQSLLKEKSKLLKKQKQNQIESSYIQTINDIIETDKAKSIKKVTSSSYNYQSNYLLNNNMLITIDCHPVPTILYELYLQRQSSGLQIEEAQLNVTKGFLPKCGYLYYTIEKIAVFIKWSQLLARKLQKKRNIQYCLMEMDDVIMSIQQTDIHPQNICSTLRNNVLLVSYPWRVALYAYYLDHVTQDQQSSSKQQRMNLLDLGIRLDLNCEIVKKFQTSIQNCLAYADNNGKINIIKLQEQYEVGFINTGRYNLRNYKSTNYSVFRQNNFKLIRRQKTIFQKLMFFIKNMQISIKCMFPAKSKPINICYNKQNQFIFVLLETQNQLQRTLEIYANETYQTLIRKEKKKKFKLIHSLTQQDVFEICHHFLTIEKRQFEMLCINSLQSKTSPDANMCIMLTTGTKINLLVSSQRISFIQSWFPPNYQSLTNMVQQLKKNDNNSQANSRLINRKNSLSRKMTLNNQKNTVHKNRKKYKEMQEYEKQQDKYICGKENNEIKMLGYSSNAYRNYVMYQANKGIYCYMTGYNNIKGIEELSQINWWQHFSKKQFRSVQEIKYFYRNGKKQKKFTPKIIEIQEQEDQQPIESHIMKTIQNKFYNTSQTNFICSAMNNITNLRLQSTYQLWRQTQFLPIFTIYSSEKVLSIAINPRPIDILFTLMMIVDNDILCIEMINKIIGVNENSNSSIQILSMLVQIYSDNQGVYYYCQGMTTTDQKLKQIIRLKKLSCLDPQIDEISQKIHERIQNQSKEEFKPYYFHNFTQKIKAKIINMSHRISENFRFNLRQEDSVYRDLQFSQQNKPENIINDGIFLYLGRVLTLIWFQKITIFSIDLTKSFLVKLTNIKRYIYEFQPYKINSGNKQCQIQVLKLLDYLIQILRFIIQLSPRIPQISLSECLSKSIQFFQRYIFLKIRYEMNSNIISKWQSMFPTFISRNLKHLINIYDKINQLQNESIDKNSNFLNDDTFQNVVMDLLKKQRDAYPAYFLKYLVEQVGIIGAKGLRRQKMFTIQTKLDHPLLTIANNIKISQYSNKYQYLKDIIKIINELLQIVQKQVDTIDNKLVLLKTVEQTLYPKLQQHHQKNIISEQQKQQLKESINYLQLKLQFQQYILDYYHKINAENCRKQQLIEQLTTVIFQDQQLFQLSKKIGSYCLECVFLCLFKRSQGTRIIIEKILESYNVVNTTIEDFKSFLHQNIGFIVWKSNYKLPCQIIIQSVEKYLLLFHHDTQSLTKSILTFQQRSFIDSSQFWLPDFLKNLGYSYDAIFQGFYQIMDQKIGDYFKYQQNQLVDEKQILLTWINTFILIKSDYKVGLTKFIEITENIIKEGRKGTGQLMLTEELALGIKNILHSNISNKSKSNK